MAGTGACTVIFRNAGLKAKAALINFILEPLLSVENLSSFLTFWGQLIIRLRKPKIVIIAGLARKSTTTALIHTVLSQQDASKTIGPVTCTLEDMSDSVTLAANLLLYQKYFALPWRYSARFWIAISLPFRVLRLALSSYPKVFVMQSGVSSPENLHRLIETAQPEIIVMSGIEAAGDESTTRLQGGVDDENRTLLCATQKARFVILGGEYGDPSRLDAITRASVERVAEKGIAFSRSATVSVCHHLGILGDAAASALTVAAYNGNGLIDERSIAVHAIHKIIGIPSDYLLRGLPMYSEASDLVSVTSGVTGRACLVTARTKRQWLSMQAAAALEGVDVLLRVGFRSIDEQVDLIINELRSGTSMPEVLGKIAAPGYSQHHSGCAVDLESASLNEAFGSTLAFRWLQLNARMYGFILTYPPNNPYGIIAEPWHWFYECCEA